MTHDSNKPVEMLACPLCQQDDVCVNDKGRAGQEDWCRVYAVVCNDCGAASGWYSTEAEAITAWNTRLSSTPTAADRNAVLEEAALVALGFEPRTAETPDEFLAACECAADIGQAIRALASASPTAAADMRGLAGELVERIRRYEHEDIERSTLTDDLLAIGEFVVVNKAAILSALSRTTPAVTAA
jgi:Lar family restriction alleviation protein